MLRQKAVCLACAGAGLLILLGMGVSAAAGPQGAGQDLAAIKAEMIRLTNAERAEANLAPLVEDARLSRAAQKHTDLMAKTQRLSHNLGVPRLGERVDRENYKWSTVIEVIYASDQPEAANAAKAVRSWMSSKAGHRGVLLSDEYTHIGVGVRYSSAGVPYFTQVFARPQ
jgi:uncharacterized protein YkwD